jgi:hypothetical protein
MLLIIIKMPLTDCKTNNMKSFVKIIAITCIAVILCQALIAQQPVYSDISIGALSLNTSGAVKKISAVSKSNNPADHPVTISISDDILKCNITINNTGNANAFGAKLIIVLPAGAIVSVATLPLNATLVSERVATRGGPRYIQFDLKVIFSNQPVTVEFTFNKSTATNKLSAFVFCGVPDANAGNNYKDVAY